MIEVTPRWQHQHPLGAPVFNVELSDKDSHPHVDIAPQVESFTRVDIIQDISSILGCNVTDHETEQQNKRPELHDLTESVNTIYSNVDISSSKLQTH